ncbi:hypothetical protein H7I77_05370 [Mycolicibacterium novocastrense]|uniref:Uncharacterized protein n=1 Tax=Mycolicibacterium novocastrense TaxID=59813 RepID=A0AAW5SHE0_MYCNV|nr:hypothetical protein [Mycolicibacterium novocastrense]MCV7022782.1 hypothetical protein [Mycolicibacterium novocastrense]GAT10356.1 uncharacterized protein RMCN_3489 [Mycolicibacterium novocastrense]
MSTPDQHAQVEIEIEDPDTGERHTFTAATEEEATAAAEDYFGVNEAQERDND